MKPIVFSLIAALCLSFTWAYAQKKEVPLFIGGYTVNNNNEGIHVFNFDQEQGKLSKLSGLSCDNPSFLTINKDKNRVYAVHELSEGKISAYDFDGKNLSLISEVSLNAAGPCHISIDPEEKFLAVSNYSEGSLQTFSLNQEGAIGDLLQEVKYEGSGVNPDRQTQPHIHSAFFDKIDNRLHVQDLGTDHMYVYSIDYTHAKGPKLSPHQIIESQPGGGPRHIAFNEDASFMYALMEMTSVLEVYKKIDTQWVRIQSVPLNDPEFFGDVGAAEVRISSDGKFLFASDRIDSNKIFSFKISERGFLSKVGEWYAEGEGPRNFTLSPNGKFLIVANQQSNNISVFEINTKNGELMHTSENVAIDAPTIVLF